MKYFCLLLVIALAGISSVSAACSGFGVDSSGVCLCYDKYAWPTGNTADCEALTSASACVAVNTDDMASAAPPTLGGGIEGNNFKLIVSFPMVNNRYISDIEYKGANTAFDYPTATSSWAVTSVGTTSCKQVFTVVIPKATTGIFATSGTTDAESYTGSVWVTTKETLSDNSVRTSVYQLKYDFSFPIATATTAQDISVVSDLDTATIVKKLSLQEALTSGDIKVTIQTSTKYPYQLNWAKTNFADETDLSRVLSSPGNDDVAAAISADTVSFCPANTPGQKCDQTFSFVISPNGECNADGTYTITLAVDSCTDDETGENCITDGNGNKVKKLITITLSLQFGDLCVITPTFLAQASDLTAFPTSARAAPKERYVVNVDSAIYFETTVSKAVGSQGEISGTSLVKVEKSCSGVAACGPANSWTQINNAVVTTETPTGVTNVRFNLPVTQFNDAYGDANVGQLEYQVKASITVYFTFGGKREVQVIFNKRASGQTSTQSQGSIILANSNTNGQTTSASPITEDTTTSSTSVFAIVGIVVGAVCVTTLIVVVIVVVAKRKNNKKKELKNKKD
jgi:hypothetical protein